MMSAQRVVRVVVVGGGVAGLATAMYVLKLAPEAEVTVLESQPRAGGNVRTLTIDGCTVDVGPDAIVNRPESGVALCREVGLGDELIAPDEGSRGILVAKGDRLVPMPAGMAYGVPRSFTQLATTELLSWRGKLRAGLDLFIPAERGDTLSAGALVERRLGKEAKDALVEPLVGGIYAGDIDRLDPKIAIPMFAELKGSWIRALARAPKASGGSPFRAPRLGMIRLVEALVERLGAERVQLSSHVEHLELRAEGIRIHRAGSAPLDADQVVLALPPKAAAFALAPSSAALADRLREIRTTSSATVVMAFPRDACAWPKASGLLVPRRAGGVIVAATFIAEKWPVRVREGLMVIRAFVGGDRSPQALGLSDQALLDAVLGELRRYLPIPEPSWSHLHRFFDATPQPEIGHTQRVQDVREAARALGPIHLVGAAYDGPGITGCARGALATAQAIVEA
jgi:oxygen-dependent protoporphyrinogen oxidase